MLFASRIELYIIIYFEGIQTTRRCIRRRWSFQRRRSGFRLPTFNGVWKWKQWISQRFFGRCNSQNLYLPFFWYFERLSNYICNNTLLNWKANSVRKDIEWLKETIQKVKMKHSTILSEPVISDGIFTYLRYLKFYLI